MAPHIVSLDDHELPSMSSAASNISFDSTFSDTYPSYSQMPPIASEPPILHNTNLGEMHTSLPGSLEGRETPRSGRSTPDDSFIRHREYFFKDGNVTFLVGGTMYCVHRYLFSRDSVYFSTRFTELGICDHEALPIIISIGDVECDDFEALLSVLYPTNFEAHELTYEQWRSVLRLSTRWGFYSLRELALKSITPPTPYDQLVLARTYSVDQWVLIALAALCERTLPLSLDEARHMVIEDVILVAMVREEIRGDVLRVDAADIPRYIEVAQARKLNRPVGPDVYLDGQNSRGTEQESDSTMASGVNPNVEAETAKTMEVGLPPGPQRRAAKRGNTDGSNEEHSQSKQAEAVLANNGIGRTRARLYAEAKVRIYPLLGLRTTVPRFNVLFFLSASGLLLFLVCVLFGVSAIHGFLNAEKAHNTPSHANVKFESDHKAKVGAEAREALWSEAMTKAKYEADLEAKVKAEAQEHADADRKAREEQEKATRTKVKADARAKKATEKKTKKGATKGEQASKRAKKAARKENASNDKSDKPPYHEEMGKRKNNPRFIRQVLDFLGTLVRYG